MYLCIYVSIHLYLYRSIDRSTYLSIYPTYPSIHLSIYLFVCLSICLCIYLSTSLSVHLSEQIQKHPLLLLWPSDPLEHRSTYSLHCSSFLGLPFRILNIELVKPQKRKYNGDSRYTLASKVFCNLPSARVSPRACSGTNGPAEMCC